MTKTYADTCLERCEKATTGPWTTDGDASSYDGDSDEYAQTWIETPAEIWKSRAANLTGTDMCKQMDTAEFIAHARFDVGELARRLKIACEIIRAQADHWYLEGAIKMTVFLNQKAKELESIPGEEGELKNDYR